MGSNNTDSNLRISVISMFVLSFLLLGFIFLMVGSNQKLFQKKYSLYMFLPNVEGLLPGAFVTLSGLKVGVVGKLDYGEKDGQQGIRIELKIDKKFAHKITESSSATIKTMGILGDKYVDISLGDLRKPPLPEGTTIASSGGMNPSALFSEVTATMKEVRAVLQNVKGISEDLAGGKGVLGKLLADEQTGKDFERMVRELRQMTHQLTEGNGTLAKMLKDTLIYKSLRESSLQFAETMNRIHDGKGSMGKLISDSTLYVQLNSVVSRTDSLLKNLNGEGTAAQLLKDKQLYQELLLLTQSLTALSSDFKKNPKKYVTFKVF